MLGKTNTPEWGAGSHTFNPVFGATRNPWNPARSAGGSSGGACGRAGLPHGAARGRQRPRRVAAQSRRVERRARTAPDARRRAALAGLGTVAAVRRRGPHGAHGRRSRAAARRAWRATTRATRSRSTPSHDYGAPLRGAWTDAAWPGARRVGGLPIDPAVRDALAGAPALLAAAGLDVSEDEPDFSGADEVFETWRAFLSATGLGDEYDARGDAMKATVRAEVERGRALTSSMLGRATAPASRARRADADVLRALRLSRVPGHAGRAVPGRGRVCGRDRWPRRWARTSSGCAPTRASARRAALPSPCRADSAVRACPSACSSWRDRSASERCSRLAHAIERRTGLGEHLPPVAV